MVRLQRPKPEVAGTAGDAEGTAAEGESTKSVASRALGSIKATGKHLLPTVMRLKLEKRKTVLQVLVYQSQRLQR